MENVIRKVGEITSLLGNFSTKNKISLPRLAVVGQQSSGKSSVLEGIIGMDILPRAAGLCTRVPLVLSIVSDTKVGDNFFGDFSHLSEEENKTRFQTPAAKTNATNISKEILRRTNELTAPNELKNSPINLVVRAGALPNLTLVDLPGLTKISVQGQSAAVVKEIETMVRDFISQESTIILAVVPANVDIANSDALSIAQEYDPRGIRTLGIVTKLDLMDKGTDALAVLENKEFFLKLGYIGVVNRGQADLNRQTDAITARKKEMEFFDLHPAYSRITDRCGFDFLKKKLGKVFASHVKSLLPKLKNELLDMLKAAETRLKELGTKTETPEKKLANCLFSFSEVFSRCLEGAVPVEKLGQDFGGAILKQAVVENLLASFEQIHALEDVSKTSMTDFTFQSMGLSPNMLFSEKTFKLFAAREIKKLAAPCLTANIKVATELSGLATHAVRACNLGRFPLLVKKVLEHMTRLVDACKLEVATKIEQRIALEASYINIDHPDFYNKPISAYKKASEETNTDIPHHERNLVIQQKVTKDLVVAYLHIVKEVLQDLLIKIVQKEYLEPLGKNLLHTLYDDFLQMENIPLLVAESEQVIREKTSLFEKTTVLQKGLKILQQISI